MKDQKTIYKFSLNSLHLSNVCIIRKMTLRGYTMTLSNNCAFLNELNMIGNKGFELLIIITYVTQNEQTICGKLFDATGISDSLLNMSDTFTKRVAAVNSSLEMETYFAGVTLHFSKMRHHADNICTSTDWNTFQTSLIYSIIIPTYITVYCCLLSEIAVYDYHVFSITHLARSSAWTSLCIMFFRHCFQTSIAKFVL